MKILFSILLNASILRILTILLSGNPEIGLKDGIIVTGGWKTYVISGIILGILNTLVKPILKILSLPFSIIFFGATSFIINAIILFLLDYFINDLLRMPGISYHISGTINFIIGVAIFTFLNIIYSLLFDN